METIDGILMQSQFLNKEGKYKDVCELLTKSTLNKFKNADLYAEKAQAAYRLEKMRDCFEAVEEALDINVNNPKANNYKANLCLKNKEYTKAINYYSKAIQNDPDYSFPYYGLGYVYDELKNYSKAIEFYNKAIDANPDFYGVYFNKAQILYMNGDYAEALPNYKRYIELKSANDNFFTKITLNKIQELTKIMESSLYCEVCKLVDEIKKILVYKKGNITHYTSLSVTRALINEGSAFRLSEGTFLNDSSEGKELFKFLPSPVITIHNQGEAIATSFLRKPFIGSFVEEIKHNDLTLWRMYGKEDKDEAKGCAITLNTQQFLEEIQLKFLPGGEPGGLNHIGEEFKFYRVAYRKLGNPDMFVVPQVCAAQVTKLNLILNILRNKLKEFNAKKNRDVCIGQYLVEKLNEIAFLFKSVEYEHENEIRLVVKGIGIEKMINNTPQQPKVYVEMVSIRSFAEKIILGPKVDHAEEWAAVFYYSLAKDNYKPEILISHLPFK